MRAAVAAVTGGLALVALLLMVLFAARIGKILRRIRSAVDGTELDRVATRGHVVLLLQGTLDGVWVPAGVPLRNSLWICCVLGAIAAAAVATGVLNAALFGTGGTALAALASALFASAAALAVMKQVFVAALKERIALLESGAGAATSSKGDPAAAKDAPKNPESGSQSRPLLRDASSTPNLFDDAAVSEPSANQSQSHTVMWIAAQSSTQPLRHPLRGHRPSVLMQVVGTEIKLSGRVWPEHSDSSHSPNSPGHHTGNAPGLSPPDSRDTGLDALRKTLPKHFVPACRYLIATSGQPVSGKSRCRSFREWLRASIRRQTVALRVCLALAVSVVGLIVALHFRLPAALYADDLWSWGGDGAGPSSTDSSSTGSACTIAQLACPAATSLASTFCRAACVCRNSCQTGCCFTNAQQALAAGSACSFAC
ncbi:hypothetical protein HK105_205875 [Polyrhizophydium stewartii]|uniref:Uncharacterized protein n=1 Tax=Polyrhizophydium stewartii TaxID=2732419 RepID=A0ABR4N4Q7_9FUNG